LFLLIIPSFVLLGVDGYNRDGDRGATVAEVDGKAITQAQWDAAHQREVDRIRSTSPNVDPKLLDSPMAKMATLERLVNEEILRVAARQSLLVTTDARLALQLQKDPVIAGLRSADGKLDLDRYRQLLASQGMTPEMYENQVREGLSEQQVLQGLDSTSWPVWRKPKLHSMPSTNAVKFRFKPGHLLRWPARLTPVMLTSRRFTTSTPRGSGLRKVQMWNMWCWMLPNWRQLFVCPKPMSKATTSKTFNA
jgi:hypothetical protein